jgi:hypothetical protein
MANPNEQTRTVRTNTPDPNAHLPEAVRRAAARANELSEQQRIGGGQPGKMVFADIGSPTPPIPELPAQPARAQPNPILRNASPSPQPAPAPAPQQRGNGQGNGQEQDRHYSESEFRAMVGRFEKASQENRDLVNRVGEMQRLLATVSSPATSQQSVNNFVPKRYVTPEDEKEWSKELVDMARRAAREVAEAELAPVRGEIQQVRQSLSGVQTHVAADARSQVYQALKERVPDWEAQNDDEGFKTWLAQIDPMYGTQRKAILMHAFDRGEASRVVATFERYQAELAASGPVQTGRSQPGNGAESSGSGNATHSRSNPATTPAVDLVSLAAPGRARPGQTQAPPDKPIVTGAEIAQFYSDVTRGKYAGRDDEYRLIESQIQEALRDGRVRR